MRLMNYALPVVLAVGITVGCSQHRGNPPVKDNVEQSLRQSGLNNVNVDENTKKGVITLKGEVASEDQKSRAAQAAQQAAPGRVIANELAVRPQGEAGEAAKDVQSNTDDAIESNFKAVIAANRWENQHIRYNAKNGVLTLTGDVDTPQQRQDAERAAASVPGVQQVVNELEIKGQKR